MIIDLSPVPFEIAVTLKTMGYPQDKCEHYHCFTNIPTYLEAKKWFENKGKYIQLNEDKCGWYCYIYDKNKNATVRVNGYFYMYEFALNAGILKALTLLKE